MRALIELDEIEYRVKVFPIFNEILNEINYLVYCNLCKPFLLAWENAEHPCFKIQGPAPYLAHDLKEAISILIEHADA